MEKFVLEGIHTPADTARRISEVPVCSAPLLRFSPGIYLKATSSEKGDTRSSQTSWRKFCIVVGYDVRIEGNHVQPSTPESSQ
jgi:hypothetical protein